MNKLSEMSSEDATLLKFDKFSKLTMSYTREGFEELKNDIKDKGQLVPILLRDGDILDGRHRIRACIELDIPVMYVELGYLSDDEAIDIVISNSLNKSTSTDSAKIEAYLMCKAKRIKNVDMSKVFNRLNINYVRKISFIEKSNPDYLRVLLNQNKVRLYNSEFEKIEDYGTINGLWRTLKSNLKFSTQVIEVVAEPDTESSYTVDLEEYFDNSSAECEYWDIYNTAKVEGINLHPSTSLGKKVASLIKHKYSGGG